MGTSTISGADLISLTEYIASINLGYLSISITVLVFLGGAFYLFNFRPLKETLEKQESALQELGMQVKTNLSESKQEIRGELEEFRTDLSTNIHEDITNENNKTLSETEKKIISFERDFFEKVNSVTDEKDEKTSKHLLSEVDNKLNTLEKNIKAEITSSAKEQRNDIDKQQKTIASLKSQLKQSNRKIRKLEVFMILKKV